MFDVTVAPPGELLARRLAQEDARRRLDAEITRTEAELERRGTCDIEFGLATGSWVAAQRDLPVGTCRHRVQISTKLVVHLPLVLAALEAGQISWEHVKVIAEAANPRIVNLIAEVQQVLIDHAQGRTFNRWKAFVQQVARELDVDGGYDPDRDQPGQLYYSPTIDGQVHFFGSIAPEDALGICAELDRVTDQLYRQAVRDHNAAPELPIPTRGELRVKGLAEVCRRSAARNLADSTPPRPEFIVTLDPDTGAGETVDGTPVTSDTLRKICPDSVWRALWRDRRGVPLNLGRGRRTSNAQQRAALAIRDGGCVFPGCDLPTTWCDSHHVIEWTDGGRTDLDNLVLLCRHHHGVTHRNGWSLTATGDGTFTWTTPSGGTLNSQRHGRQRQPDRQPHAA